MLTYKRSRPLSNISVFFFFFRHIQHIRRVFLLLLSPLLCSPPLSPLVGFVFHERHVKHTDHVEWNTVEMLIVRFISAETMREEEERRKKSEPLRSLGKTHFKSSYFSFRQHSAKSARSVSGAIHSVSKSHLFPVVVVVSYRPRVSR